MVTVENWILEKNLVPVINLLSNLCGYIFTDLDSDAIIAGLRDDVYFTYSLVGRDIIELTLYRESGETVYNIKVSSAENYLMAIETILQIAQSYELNSVD